MLKQMAEPVDKKMYDQIAGIIKSKYPISSAYRSGLIVKKYKEEFFKKYGSKSPYTGRKPTGGLTRWFKEEWRNQRGEVGYSQKGDIYRPTKKITKDTPTTFSELSQKQIKESSKEKIRTGRVKKF